MDLTLLGSTQLHSGTVLSRRTNTGATGGVRNIPWRLQEIWTTPAPSVAHFVPYKGAL